MTDRAALTQQLEAARRNGYASAEGEVSPGVSAIAVPVLDAAGRIVAALNITAHAHEVTVAELAAKHLGHVAPGQPGHLGGSGARSRPYAERADLVQAGSTGIASTGKGRDASAQQPLAVVQPRGDQHQQARPVRS